MHDRSITTRFASKRLSWKRGAKLSHVSGIEQIQIALSDKVSQD